MKAWLVFMLLGWGVASPGQTLETVTFHLDWFPGPQFAGLFLANDLGYYRAAGLRVEFVPFKFGGDAPAAIARSSTCALGTIEGYIFLQKRGPDADLRALAATLQESPAGFMSLDTAGIHSARDFAGKKIGVHKFAAPLYRWFLRRVDLDEKAATMETVGDDLALLTGGQLAAMQGYASEEFVRLHQVVGDRARFLSFRELGFEAYSEVLFTTRDQLSRHRAAIKAFVDATRRGWIETLARPDRAVAALRSRSGPEFDEQFARAALEALRPFLAPQGQSPLSPMDPAKWNRMEISCVEMGLRQTAEPVDAFLSSEFAAE